jgi:antirestriction protein ArdC
MNGERYRGINTVMLWVAAAERGYRTPHWSTYKQAKALGAQVRKGETGSLVVYADTFIKTVEDKETGKEEDVEMSFLKGYTVFNASQIDGLPAKFYEVPEFKLMDTPERLLAADAFVRHTGANVVEQGYRAAYAPGTDTISMPPLETFRDRESFYAVELHELTHWTAHKTRLDRPLVADHRSDDYAKEELIAEIGSAFLCARLEITPTVREDHAGYLAGWLRVMKADKRAIFAAAAHAQRSTDFLFGLQPKSATDPA